MGFGKMQAKRRWSKAYRHVMYPQLWKQITRRNTCPREGSSAGSPSPTRNRHRLFPQASITAREIEESKKYLFHPDGKPVFYWMGLVSVATIYNYWTVILRIAFPEIKDQYSFDVLYFLDSLWDLVYLCDITVQMRTAFMMDGIPVYEIPRIVRHYTRQNLFIRDVISILPTETLVNILPATNIVFLEPGTARLNRLLKIHCVYKFYDLADSRTSNPNGIRACRLTLSLVTVIHWIGCLYYIVSQFEGLGSNNWVYTSDPDKQRILRKYVVCLYWSAMTLTTIGDCSPPETDLEYVFTGLTFLIGVFVFATVVGNVGDVISNMNASRAEFQARMDQIKVYLTHRKVPASLQMKVKKWADYSWSRTQATDEYRLLNMLPERLRAEIAVHVHLDTLSKVKIFEQCEKEFLCELVLKLRSQIYSPGDYICRVGETGREMYIINHGKVEVVVNNSTTGQDVVVAVLSEGNYFGEISLLRLEGVQNRRTADVRSVGYSELLCLSRKDLTSALVEYPEAKAILEEQARERIRSNMQAKRSFSVDDFEGTEGSTSPAPDLLDDKGQIHDGWNEGRELLEIRSLIESLHRTHKEVPEKKIHDLQEKCTRLGSLLSLREAELEAAVRRLGELEVQLTRTTSSPADLSQLTEPLDDDTTSRSSYCPDDEEDDEEVERPRLPYPRGLSQDRLRYALHNHINNKDLSIKDLVSQMTKQGSTETRNSSPTVPEEAPSFLAPGIVVDGVPTARTRGRLRRRKGQRTCSSLDTPSLSTLGPPPRRVRSPSLSCASTSWTTKRPDFDL